MPDNEGRERVRRFALDLLTHHGEPPYRTGAAERACVLARAYLAEHPADDGEPITEDWLRSVAHSVSSQGIYFNFTTPGLTLVLDREPLTVRQFVQAEIRQDDQNIALGPVHTRGDFRRLCAALQIPLKEQP